MSAMSAPTTRAFTSYITFPNVDRVCQYIPLASTVLNLDVLFEKFVHRNECIIDNLSNRKVSYIQTKHMARTLIGLIPVFGNVILILNLMLTRINHRLTIMCFGPQFKKNLNSAIFQDYYSKAGSKQTKGYYSSAKLEVGRVQTIADALKENEYVFCKSKIRNEADSLTEYYNLFITSRFVFRIDPDKKTGIELSDWARGNDPATYASFEELFKEKFPNTPLSDIKRRNGDDFL